MQRTLVGLAILLVGALVYLFGYPEPPVDPDWQVAGNDDIPGGAISVRFSGTSTLLFSDGETTWMIDGWFTRPGPLKTLMGSIEPDMAAIDFGLASNEVDRLAAVIPMHSHYDHAMDSPEVARRTGAMLIGSEATANIGRGWGLPEEQIQVFEDGEAVQLGEFVITPIESRHFQFPNPKLVASLLTDAEIPAPLVPPVSAFDYKLGKAYVLHVAHPRGKFMVVASAGYVPGQLQGLEVDVLFLGVGGLGSQTASYREGFWQETVLATSPGRLIPIHWDSLTGPLDGPFTGEVRIAGLISPGEANTLAFMKAKENAHPDIEILTLPRFEPVVLFK